LYNFLLGPNNSPTIPQTHKATFHLPYFDQSGNNLSSNQTQLDFENQTIFLVAVFELTNTVHLANSIVKPGTMSLMQN
jgi:hypothetical protein